MEQHLLSKEYDSAAARHVKDIVSIELDLQEALEYIKELMSIDKNDESKKIIRRGLWKSALITFFKCFSSGIRRYSLNKKIYSHFPGQPLEAFEFLKNIRDKHFAHSVSALDEIQVGAVINPSSEKVVGAQYYQRRLDTDTDEARQNLLVMIEFAISVIEKEYSVSIERVRDEVVAYGYEEVIGWADLEIYPLNQIVGAAKSRNQKLGNQEREDGQKLGLIISDESD